MRVPHGLILKSFFILVVFVLLYLVYLFLSRDLVLLQPKGFIANEQYKLLIFAFILSMFVIIPVFAMTIIFSLKYRETNKKTNYQPNYDSSKTLESLWWGIPILIIGVLSVVTWKTSHSLDPSKPIASDTPAVKVQVVAMQWNWLFIYPDYDVASMNRLVFPEKTPLNLELTSDAPMNSFWIPDLGGQIYAMAGMKTKLHLMSDSKGIFRGSSANISGGGFADMDFTAQATSRNDFLTWINTAKYSQNDLDWIKYGELSKPQNDAGNLSYFVTVNDMFDEIIHKYNHNHDEDNRSEFSALNSLRYRRL